MPEKSFSQVTTSDGQELFVLTSLQDGGKDGISLTVTNGKNAWSGEVDGEDLISTSRRIKMKPEEYLEQTCKALTGNHSAGINFQYEMKKKERSAEFSWKKSVSGVKLGSIKLTAEADFTSVIKEVFEFCINTSQNQVEQIRTLQANKERLATERSNALKRLEKCVAAKEELENDLYSKVIINSKKAKIRQIRAEVEDARNSEPIQSTSKAHTKRRISSSPEPEPVKSDAETDDEKSDNYDSDRSMTPPKKLPRRNAIVPTDDSSPLLFLGDEEEPEKKKAPLARRGKRQANANSQKKTPSKPVIPKVSSGKKPALSRGSSGSSSTSGGGRSSSRRSTSQVDADDLMDLM